ncbi:MAG: sensor histidine kinase [Candidatus Heimdallarchaeota archaeon]
MNRQELEVFDRLRFAISHEIRGAITIAKGYSEFARKGRYGPLDLKIAKAFESIERMADRITAVASNVTEFMRFHFQNASIIKKKVQNANFLESAILSVHLEAKKKEIAFETFLNKDLSFWADEKALQLVLVNILRNAVQFSPEGKTVMVRMESHNDELVISAEDEGVGLSDLDMKKLWLQPEDIQPQHGKKGACFGLRIARILIEQHGGTIEAASAGKEKGTQFVIRLPRSL